MTEAQARPPPVTRAVAGVSAIGIALFFLALQPLAWLDVGCTLTAAASAILALLLVAFYATLAAAPRMLARPLARWTRVDLADPAQGIALILIAGVLFFVLGLGGAVGAAATLESAAVPTCKLDATATGAALGNDVVQGVAVNFAIFTLPVLFYIAVVHKTGPIGTFDALGLRPGRANARAAAIGAGAAVVFLVALTLLETAALRVIPETYLQNPRALDIARTLTPMGAFALAIAAGVGEEVFFRGFLQPRVGMLASAGLFALAHVSYASISEVVVVFALALALGELYRRTGNLAAPIAMHFVFDLVNLLAGATSA